MKYQVDEVPSSWKGKLMKKKADQIVSWWKRKLKKFMRQKVDENVIF